MAGASISRSISMVLFNRFIKFFWIRFDFSTSSGAFDILKPCTDDVVLVSPAVFCNLGALPFLVPEPSIF